ncbi:MAG: ABC transporter ATP-binding protein [Phycisphaeraceae bacterium JB051]
MSTPLDIQVTHLAKRFGRKQVLEDVSFQIKRGQTFALLGRNGAGKTTMLRMLMGLLKPDKKSPSGQDCSMSVLGMDPSKKAIEVRSRVGYLAEDQKMFGWMSIRQILDFMAPFYPKWDKALAERYRKQFELAEITKVKHLSKGQGVRLGLLCALAHRPQLVILDDPALGLDPIMRKEFNRDLIVHLQSEGSTVFYSSHLLYEVEPIADEIAILDRGRIIIQKDTDTLRNDVKKLIMDTHDFDAHQDKLSLLDVYRGYGKTNVTITNAQQTIEQLRRHTKQFQVIDLNLDEIFEAYVIGKTDITQNNQSDQQSVLHEVAS